MNKLNIGNKYKINDNFDFHDIPCGELLKAMDKDSLKRLCKNLREKIIASTAAHGGHLASNLGMVEATVALHRIFNLENDKIIFDVGHQCYTHKLLTERAERFDSLREFNGLSGFSCPTESEHDPFYAGHCGTSLSAAIGVAEAKRISGDNSFTVAVIGDAAFSNGMVFEALNDLSGKKLKLIILLNDNEMSISHNVGGLSDHFSKIRTSKRYFNFKNLLKRVISRVPLIDETFFKHTKDTLKRLVVQDNLFECLGIDYLGPVDGHDIEKLETVLTEAKEKHICCIVHMVTKKGYGYPPAEKHPEMYHSVAPFNPNTVLPSSTITEKSCISSETISDFTSFSEVFGDIACKLGEENPKICCITAAMCSGTGLKNFSQRFNDRFFDVGIAEEHAVTFAGALGKFGCIPICAIYSTFLQRCYDQIIHDVALQNSPVIFAVDRAGIVPGDGTTHQGVFDVSFLTGIPNMTIYSPDSYSELRHIFYEASRAEKSVAIRYPRGEEEAYDRSLFKVPCKEYDNIMTVCDIGKIDCTPPNTVIITYGKITSECFNGAKIAIEKENKHIRIIKLIKIHPIDINAIAPLISGADQLLFIEEGIKDGGISEKIASAIVETDLSNFTHPSKTSIHAINNFFPTQGTRDQLLNYAKLDRHSISKLI